MKLESIVNVSVVIPLFRKERFIARALESVLAQTFPYYEVVVVNDGSDDGSVDIVESYAARDRRISLVHQRNAGPGAARNRGMREAAAAFVAFLDADDEWSPGHLAALVGILNRHADCAAVCVAHVPRPGAAVFDAEVWRRRGIREGIWRVTPETSPKAIAEVRSFFTPCSAIGCRREVALALGGFYEDGCTYREDAYLVTRMLFRYPVYLRLEPTVYYHQDASDLGLSSGRKSFPLEPLLKNAVTELADCPAPYRSLLSQFIDYEALAAARRHIKHEGDCASAMRVLREFPGARSLGYTYSRVLLDIIYWTSRRTAERAIRNTPWMLRLARKMMGRRPSAING